VIGFTAAGLSLLALLLALRLLPETRQFGGAPLDRKWLNWSGLRRAFVSPSLAPVVLTFFLATLGFGAFEVTLALLLKDALGFGEDQSFLMFAYVGFILLLTQGLIYRRLARRVSEASFMLSGILLMALGVAALGLVSWMSIHQQAYGQRMTILMLALTAAVMGFAFLTPSAQALISRRTDASHQGEILGVNQSAAAMARILGPIFGVTLYKLTPDHLLPYLFGAGLLLLMLPLMPRIRRG
jgi:NADH:ubiquinone oxidoreductase subunit 3 (subunit A)